MWHLLQQIRAKPVNVRKRILLVTTASLALIIFLVWASTFISTISQATPDKGNGGKSTFSFLGTFQNAFTDIFETASGDMKGLKASFLDSTNTYMREKN